MARSAPHPQKASRSAGIRSRGSRRHRSCLVAIFPVPEKCRSIACTSRTFTMEARSPSRPIGPHPMKFEVRIDGRASIVELARDADHWQISIDDRIVDADAVEIAPGIFSILLNGKSYEVRVTPTPAGALTLQTAHQEFTAEVIDPRTWRGRRHGALEAEGRQQILAPMPGKIIRVLVQTGRKSRQ